MAWMTASTSGLAFRSEISKIAATSRTNSRRLKSAICCGPCFRGCVGNGLAPGEGFVRLPRAWRRLMLYPSGCNLALVRSWKRFMRDRIGQTPTFSLCSNLTVRVVASGSVVFVTETIPNLDPTRNIIRNRCRGVPPESLGRFPAGRAGRTLPQFEEYVDLFMLFTAHQVIKRHELALAF